MFCKRSPTCWPRRMGLAFMETEASNSTVARSSKILDKGWVSSIGVWSSHVLADTWEHARRVTSNIPYLHISSITPSPATIWGTSKTRSLWTQSLAMPTSLQTKALELSFDSTGLSIGSSSPMESYCLFCKQYHWLLSTSAGVSCLQVVFKFEWRAT